MLKRTEGEEADNEK